MAMPCSARFPCWFWFLRCGFVCSLTLQLSHVQAQSFREWAVSNGVADTTASDDNDRDGLTHLMEYALGLPPQKADATFCRSDSRGWFITKGAMAANAGNMRWVPQISTDLRSWTLPPNWSETNESLTVALDRSTFPCAFFRITCRRLTHPTALRYALATGLSGVALNEVSDFLYELDDCGISADFLLLNGSRYRARQDNIMRAVIGGSGAMTGNIADEERAQSFDGSAAWIEFANPAQSTALPRYSLFAIASTASTTQQSLVASSWASEDARGIRLMFNASSSWGLYPGRIIADVNSGTSSSANGWNSVYRSHHANQLLPISVSFDAQTTVLRGDLATPNPTPLVTLSAGILRSSAAFAGLGNTVWNGSERFRVGANLNGGAFHTGKIAMVLITRSAITEESVYQRLATAAQRAGIVPRDDQSVVVVCDGDSITEGAGSPYSQYGQWSWPAQLQGGNADQFPGGQWTGNFSVRNLAVGGRAIASSEAAWEHSTRHILARREWGQRFYFTMISHNQADMGSAANLARLEQLWLKARALGAQPVCIGLVPTQTTEPALRQRYLDTNSAILQLAGKNRIPFVDISQLSQLSGNPFPSGNDFFYTDAIHLTEKGYRLIAQEIAASVAFPGSSAPRSLARPALTGPTLVGADMQTNRGQWQHSPTQFTYQWMRNASDITGANAAFYRLTEADRGARLSCRITARNAFGTAERTSPHSDTVR